ncbi:jhy protein homolog [Leptodactylus fuscus]|uniref:jhy protein homolog n=1 Tax=Leptodactylus fuscus TaxID=238119 RepID=UPI003F4F052D
MEADNTVRSLQGPLYNGGDLDLGLSSDSLDNSDTDSLDEEMKYQSELQNRIHSNHEVIFQTKGGTGESQAVVTAGDTQEYTQELSHKGKEAKPNIRSQEIRTSYSELRYDPDWRKHQNLLHTPDRDEEEFLDVSSVDSEECSPDEMTLGTSEDKNSEDGHSFWKPLTEVLSKNKEIAATTKPKSKESGQVRRYGAHLDTTEKKKVMAQHQVTQKDIIEKNKATLGVRKEKPQSYLHFHKKKTKENKFGQNNRKSDVQPMEDILHMGEKVKLPEAIKESRISSSHSQKKRTNPIYMASTLSDVNTSQWDGMYSGKYYSEYMAIPAYPENYRNSFIRLDGPYSLQEHLQIHNEGLYYQNIKPSEMRYDLHRMEDLTMGGAEDSMEKHMYPSQITPQSMEPTMKSQNSSNEPEVCAKDEIRSERTKMCPSGVRKPSEKYQKRLKSLLNEEVKLGGLGPVHTISEEKKEQLKQQKEYAKVIQERNRSKPAKPKEIQVTPNDKNKSTRQKSLEYAKYVPRPQPPPRVSSERRTDVPAKRTMSCDSLFPQMKLLEDLQARHEKEKMAVAALNALHIL